MRKTVWKGSWGRKKCRFRPCPDAEGDPGGARRTLLRACRAGKKSAFLPCILEGENGGAAMRKKRISAKRMEKGSSVLCGKAALRRYAGYGSPLPKADAGVLCPGRTVYGRLFRRTEKNDGRVDVCFLSAARRKASGLDAGRRDPATILGGLLRARASGFDRLTAAHRVRFVGVEGEIKDQPSRFRPFSQVFASASKGGRREERKGIRPEHRGSAPGWSGRDQSSGAPPRTPPGEIISPGPP